MDALQRIQVLRSRYGNKLKVGFTGSRDGMSLVQWDRVEGILVALWLDSPAGVWHNGDCLGADHQTNMTVTRNINTDRVKRGVEPIFRVGHPCNLKKWRAHDEYDQEYVELPPLTRNRKIVRMSDIMLAAPKEFDEVMRGSGTWATIRAAQALKPLIIVFPDGSLKFENVD